MAQLLNEVSVVPLRQRRSHPSIVDHSTLVPGIGA